MEGLLIPIKTKVWKTSEQKCSEVRFDKLFSPYPLNKNTGFLEYSYSSSGVFRLLDLVSYNEIWKKRKFWELFNSSCVLPNPTVNEK